MELGDGERRYRWIDEWASVPATGNGRTHGVAVASDGRVVVFHQAEPAVLVFGSDGELEASWGAYPGAHGLTLVTVGGEDRLWLTDQGSGAIHQTTIDGTHRTTLESPAHPAYENGSFVPTWVAAADDDPAQRWVADGYGEGLVHRYEGTDWVGTIDGTEGAGRFDCPHSVTYDGRTGGYYVADRGNERLQVFEPDGTFRETIGTAVLTSPCSVARSGRDLVIPELFGRVTLLGPGGEATILGENAAAVDREDWPNLPQEALEVGRFNSPHDAAVDDDGAIYVVEWIVGGRISKLEPR